MNALRIVVIGESWHGSSCTGLARGFRAGGHAVELIGLDTFVPTVDRSLAARALRRALAPFCRAQYNRRMLAAVHRLRPDLVVVYKGTAVAPATLADFRRRGVWLCHVMPDIRVEGHWSLDPRIFGYFDHVFTTKSFGVAYFRERHGVRNVSFLPHGFDPHVHRPLAPVPSRPVSFIGSPSPRKEAYLRRLADAVGWENLDVWGEGWGGVRAGVLRRSVHGAGVYGDFYAAAVSGSRINLGLQHEGGPGYPSGDLTTERTFLIPACGGFLLHERTGELADYYEEGRECACFGSPDELVEKVSWYLRHDDERVRIARAGHRRCVRENALSVRADAIIRRFLAERPAGAGAPVDAAPGSRHA